MATPQHIEFFQDNHEMVEGLIDRENEARVREGLPKLTNEEFDAAIGQMIAFTNGGRPLPAFTFPGRKEAAPIVKKPISNVGMSAPKAAPAVSETPGMHLTIENGANGKILRMRGDFYIFKTPEDLLEIIRTAVFETKPPTKRKGEK